MRFLSRRREAAAAEAAAQEAARAECHAQIEAEIAAERADGPLARLARPKWAEALQAGQVDTSSPLFAFELGGAMRVRIFNDDVAVGSLVVAPPNVAFVGRRQLDEMRWKVWAEVQHVASLDRLERTPTGFTVSFRGGAISFQLPVPPNDVAEVQEAFRVLSEHR
jgi:hypothetical protein